MKINLKNNQVTTDPRLDRIIHFDTRSKRYPIRALHSGKKFRSYTWNFPANHKVLDQGNAGSCVGNGIANELACRPAPVMGIDEKYAVEDIYWPAQKQDRWPGGAYPGASPSYEGTAVLYGVMAAQSLGWFDEYRWAFSLEDLIMGVGHNGPAVLGLKWKRGMFKPDEGNYIHATGGDAGGHCLLCNAVAIQKKRFTLTNSWGPGWGINGAAYISFDDMSALLADHGEAVFFLHRHNRPEMQ